MSFLNAFGSSSSSSYGSSYSYSDFEYNQNTKNFEPIKWQDCDTLGKKIGYIAGKCIKGVGYVIAFTGQKIFQLVKLPYHIVNLFFKVVMTIGSFTIKKIVGLTTAIIHKIEPALNFAGKIVKTICNWTVVPLANLVSKGAAKIIQYGAKIFQGIGCIFRAIAKVAKTICHWTVVPLKNFSSAILSKIGQCISAIMHKTILFGGKIIKTVFDWTVVPFANLVSNGVSIIVQCVSKILQGIAGIFRGTAKIVKAINSWTVVPLFDKAIIPICKAIFSQLNRGIKFIVQKIITPPIKLVIDLAQSVFSVFQPLFRGIGNAFDGCASLAGKVYKNIISPIIHFPGDLINGCLSGCTEHPSEKRMREMSPHNKERMLQISESVSKRILELNDSSFANVMRLDDKSFKRLSEIENTYFEFIVEQKFLTMESILKLEKPLLEQAVNFILSNISFKNEILKILPSCDERAFQRLFCLDKKKLEILARCSEKCYPSYMNLGFNSPYRNPIVNYLGIALKLSDQSFERMLNMDDAKLNKLLRWGFKFKFIITLEDKVLEHIFALSDDKATLLYNCEREAFQRIINLSDENLERLLNLELESLRRIVYSDLTENQFEYLLSLNEDILRRFLALDDLEEWWLSKYTDYTDQRFLDLLTVEDGQFKIEILTNQKRERLDRIYDSEQYIKKLAQITASQLEIMLTLDEESFKQILKLLGNFYPLFQLTDNEFNRLATLDRKGIEYLETIDVEKGKVYLNSLPEVLSV